MTSLLKIGDNQEPAGLSLQRWPNLIAHSLDATKQVFCEVVLAHGQHEVLLITGIEPPVGAGVGREGIGIEPPRPASRTEIRGCRPSCLRGRRSPLDTPGHLFVWLRCSLTGLLRPTPHMLTRFEGGSASVPTVR